MVKKKLFVNYSLSTIHYSLFGLVLTGGKSTRMGQDKSLIKYHGKEQALVSYELLSRYCEKVFISCRQDQKNLKGRKGFPQIIDKEIFSHKTPGTSHKPYHTAGPLIGILSAMQEYPNAAWVVLACDLPLIDEKTIYNLIQNRDPKKPATAYTDPQNHLPEPLCAIWEPAIRPRLLKFLKKGITCPRKILINSDVKLLRLRNKRALENVNTKVELNKVNSIGGYRKKPSLKTEGLMQIKNFLVTLAALFILTGNSLAAEPLKSTRDDQSGVEVTVYNNNLGLIKDVRKIDLPAGQGELRFMDVASQIMPQTVHIESLNQKNAFTVLEQNYEYDLMDSNKLLDKYVDKQIKLIERNEFQNTQKEIEATLLSNNSGQIFQIGNEIYLGHPGYKVLPKIPENLIAKPTLTWQFSNKSTGQQEIKVSYLTNGIDWLADYIMVVDKTDALSSLNGWVTVNNTSGATYKDAKLKLIAGEVNRVQAPQMMMEYRARKSMAMLDTEATGFAEKAFFEYHIYDLQRPTTIKDKQTKQISLLEASGVKLTKEMLAYGQQQYYMGNYGQSSKIKVPVNVYIKFKNSKENNLGMPLPAGTIRLYKEDSSASQQFIGEDQIKHTPKDEEIKLKIGEAFDVVTERKQTDYQVFGNNTYETGWEITLRNHKEEAVTISLVEPVAGDWQVLDSTHPYVKEDAFNLRFNINVPKDGEVVVKYKVRVKY